MPLKPESLYISEWPLGGARTSCLELRRCVTGEIYATADSRREMDLKLALLGLEADWSYAPSFYLTHAVRSLK